MGTTKHFLLSGEPPPHLTGTPLSLPPWFVGQDAEDPGMLGERHMSWNEIMEGKAGHQHGGLRKGMSWELGGFSSRGQFVNSLSCITFSL